jgi:hypothetical protein
MPAERTSRATRKASPRRQARWIDTSRLPKVRPSEKPILQDATVLFSFADDKGYRVQFVGMVTNPGLANDPFIVTIERVLSLKENGIMHPPAEEGLGKIFLKADERTANLYYLRAEEHRLLVAGDIAGYEKIRKLRPK